MITRHVTQKVGESSERVEKVSSEGVFVDVLSIDCHPLQVEQLNQDAACRGGGGGRRRGKSIAAQRRLGTIDKQPEKEQKARTKMRLGQTFVRRESWIRIEEKNKDSIGDRRCMETLKDQRDTFPSSVEQRRRRTTNLNGAC